MKMITNVKHNGKRFKKDSVLKDESLFDLFEKKGFAVRLEKEQKPVVKEVKKEVKSKKSKK